MIVRADLPVGFAIAQAVHAAGESALGGPVPDGTNAVVLCTADEAHLRRVFKMLDDEGLHPFLIVEPDAPYNGAATAIGIPPRLGRIALLRELPLYGKEVSTRGIDALWLRGVRRTGEEPSGSDQGRG